jgi:hypothetical protein
LEGTHAARFETDDVMDQIPLVKEFVESLNLWALVRKDKESSERIAACGVFDSTLDELDRSGLWVFGGCSSQRLPAAAEKQVLDVAILRDSSRRIIHPKGLSQLGKDMCGAIVVVSREHPHYTSHSATASLKDDRGSRVGTNSCAT